MAILHVPSCVCESEAGPLAASLFPYRGTGQKPQLGATTASDKRLVSVSEGSHLDVFTTITGL